MRINSCDVIEAPTTEEMNLIPLRIALEKLQLFMWIIKRVDFEGDLTDISIKLIVSEVAELQEKMTDWCQQRLSKEMKQYGYVLEAYTSSKSKNYVLAYRDFYYPRKKQMPKKPELEVYTSIQCRRMRAEDYEQQRIKMGYVTQEELALASECIKAEKVPAFPNEKNGTLKNFRLVYGLLWLGYDSQQTSFLVSVGVIQCTNQRSRLTNLRIYRNKIGNQEEFVRLSNFVQTKQAKSARFVEDYLRVEAIRNTSKSQGSESSILANIFSYFKSFRQDDNITTEDAQQESQILKYSLHAVGQEETAHTKWVLKGKNKRQ